MPASVVYGCAGTGGALQWSGVEDLYYCQGCQQLCGQAGVLEEVDSYYCPHCLENLASSEAFALGGRCKKCFTCPRCTAPLALHQPPSPANCHFRCGYCRWDSLPLALAAPTPAELLAAALERERNDPLQAQITQMVQRLQKEEKDKAKEKRQMTRIRRGSLPFRPVVAPPTARPPPITMEELEKNLEAKDKSRQLLKPPAEAANTTTEEEAVLPLEEGMLHHW